MRLVLCGVFVVLVASLATGDATRYSLLVPPDGAADKCDDAHVVCFDIPGGASRVHLSIVDDAGLPLPIAARVDDWDDPTSGPHRGILCGEGTMRIRSDATVLGVIPLRSIAVDCDYGVEDDEHLFGTPVAQPTTGTVEATFS